MKPALTPDEWANYKAFERTGPHGEELALSAFPNHGFVEIGDVRVEGVEVGGNLHAVAALCLYRNDFGFSQLDVDRLESRGLYDIAERVRALLPPLEPQRWPQGFTSVDVTLGPLGPMGLRARGTSVRADDREQTARQPPVDRDRVPFSPLRA